MATLQDLLTTYSSNHRPTSAEYKRYGYFSNGWNSVRRWSASTAAVETAGISAPSQVENSWTPAPYNIATDTTEGYRVFRYRYLDSRTGYVSNPSTEFECTDETVESSASSLRFLIGAALSPEAAITNMAITATTITRPSGSWSTYGLALGDYITITNAEDSANNGTYGPIRTLSATVITIPSASWTVNADDDTIQVARAQRGRIKPSTDSKVDKIVLEATVVSSTPEKSGRTFGPHTTGLNIANKTITRDSGSWVSDGFDIGDYILLEDAEDAANSGTWGPITKMTATVLTIASGGFTTNTDDTAATWTLKTKEDPGASEFFKAAEALNTASSIDFSMTDSELELQFLPWSDDGHDPPPIAQNIVSHRERIWLFGQVTHSIGTATFTNASTTVAQGSSPDWNTEALGASAGASSVQWLIRATGSNEATYEISYYTGSDIIMKTAYADGTETVAYKIFSRANVVWVSEPGYPESFSPLRFINGPNAADSNNLTAGVGYGSSMVFYSPSGMYRYSWDTDPLEDGFWTPLSNKAGALNQRVVIEHEGTIYSMDRRGWHAWRGTFPTLISRPLGSILSSIDFAYADRFHACYLPDSRAIRWWVTYTGDTYPKNYVQYDVDTGAWSTGTYLQGITDSRLIDHGSGLRVFLLDDQGYSWWADTGLADGCPAANSHITTTTGSTTTVIQSATTLPTSGTGLAGMYLNRRTSAGASENRLISSNTSSAITVSSAFSSAPGTGVVMWVGPIPSKIKTRAFGLKPNAKVKTRTGYVTLMFKPTSSARYLQVRVYEDYSSTAKTWSTAQNNRTGLAWPGSNTRYPTADWVVDLSTTGGVVHVPIGSEWKKFFEVEIETDEPDSDFYLISMEYDGQVLEEKGL